MVSYVNDIIYGLRTIGFLNYQRELELKPLCKTFIFLKVYIFKLNLKTKTIKDIYTSSILTKLE